MTTAADKQWIVSARADDGEIYFVIRAENAAAAEAVAMGHRAGEGYGPVDKVLEVRLLDNREVTVVYKQTMWYDGDWLHYNTRLAKLKKEYMN